MKVVENLTVQLYNINYGYCFKLKMDCSPMMRIDSNYDIKEMNDSDKCLCVNLTLGTLCIIDKFKWVYPVNAECTIRS